MLVIIGDNIDIDIDLKRENKLEIEELYRKEP